MYVSVQLQINVKMFQVTPLKVLLESTDRKINHEIGRPCRSEQT